MDMNGTGYEFGRVVEWSSGMPKCKFFLNSFCEAIFVYGCRLIVFCEGVGKYTAKPNIEAKFKPSNYAGDQTLVRMITEEIFKTRNIYMFIYNPGWERVLRT